MYNYLHILLNLQLKTMVKVAAEAAVARFLAQHCHQSPPVDWPPNDQPLKYTGYYLSCLEDLTPIKKSGQNQTYF